MLRPPETHSTLRVTPVVLFLIYPCLCLRLYVPSPPCLGVSRLGCLGWDVW